MNVALLPTELPRQVILFSQHKTDKDTVPFLWHCFNQKIYCSKKPQARLVVTS